MRLGPALLLLMLTTPALSGEPASAPKSHASTVDLDAPRQMQVLAKSNPEHYAKVLRIMQESRFHAPEGIPRWLKAAFNADDGWAPPLLMTGNPPQRRLAFTLDGTRYTKRVYFGSPAQPEPLR